MKPDAPARQGMGMRLSPQQMSIAGIRVHCLGVAAELTRPGGSREGENLFDVTLELLAWVFAPPQPPS